MTRLALNFGLIAGAITSAMLCLLLFGIGMNHEYGELLGYSSMILAFSTIYFAIKNYRDEQLEGIISFAKAFQIGLAITMIASTIYVLTWMVISNFGGEEAVNEYFQKSLENLRASDLPQAEISKKVAEMEAFRESYDHPFVKIGVTYLEIFPVGLLVSLIAAFLLKRK